MIELDEDRMSSLSECVEKSLKYMGRVMHCLSELEESGESGKSNGRSRRDYDDEREYRGSRYSRY